MCGPIALVTPSAFPGNLGRFFSGLIYNAGRILTYMILGLVAGLAGKGVNFMHGQQVVSIVLGSLIVLSALAPTLFQSLPANPAGIQLNAAIKRWLSSVLKMKSPGGILAIGLANGLLPCGLVYIGLAGSLDQANWQGGSLFMMFFGLGTVPMMSGVHLIGNNLKGSFKNKLSRIIPVFVFVMGVLLILRGLGLGIPYISPSMDPHTGDMECHSPAHRHIK